MTDPPFFSPKIYRVVEALHVLSFFGLDRINSVYKCFFIFPGKPVRASQFFFILSAMKMEIPAGRIVSVK